MNLFLTRYTNVPPFVVNRVYHYYAPNKLLTPSQNALLLRDGRDVFVIDTVFGESLIRHSRTVGVAPSEVTAVLVTHFHLDHSGGVLDKSGKAAYQNALVCIQRIYLEFWDGPAEHIAEQYPHLPFDLAVNQSVTTLANVKKLYAGEFVC